MTTAASSIIGSIHRFGPDGVLYEVIEKQSATTALIRVLETEEELSYPFADIHRDPTE
jgi:hypothetical protein